MADAPADPPDYPDRVRGALLGTFCGDALGAAVENMPPGRIAARFPDGLLQMVDHPRGRGRYTDDFQMTLALARHLAEHKACDAAGAAAAYAKAFEPRRGYAAAASRALEALKSGADPAATGRMDFPEGSYGNGGAMRIAPVGLAYRHAPVTVLENSVQAALLCTHVHPQAVDGALMQAAAVAWLCKRRPDRAGCTPAALVSHLRGVVRTAEADRKLGIIADALEQQVRCLEAMQIVCCVGRCFCGSPSAILRCIRSFCPLSMSPGN